MAKNNKSGQSLKDALQSVFAMSAILLAIVVSILVFLIVMGNPANFEGNNPAGHPLPGNYLGMIYKGGVIVPLLMTCIVVLLTFTIERLITVELAKGGPVGYTMLRLFLRVITFGLSSIVMRKYNAGTFLRNVQSLLAADKIEEAIVECDIQKGSIANVAKAALLRYRELQNDTKLEKEQKVLAMQKEFDEAAALELPMLSKNLIILSTIASISVLIGLIGTVLGMIRAFGALAQAGAPDALALATGISEALINTAFGIIGSTFAIIFYNYFSSVIDGMTFKIDEAGFSIVQTFAANTK
ncbi:MAG: MotA/TolQ/ExbB proton channel family protein [Bacteroidales bacterium]